MGRFLFGVCICAIGFAAIWVGLNIQEERFDRTEEELSINSVTPDGSYEEPEAQINEYAGTPASDIDGAQRSLSFDERYTKNLQGNNITEVANPSGIAGTTDFLETVSISAIVGAERPRCSGVLIHREVILTARHCFKKRKDAGNDLKGYETKPNGHTISYGRIASTPPVFRIKSIAISHGDVSSDLALLHLAAPAPDNIPIAKFATEGALKNATWMRVVGFGDTVAKGQPIPEVGAGSICDQYEPVPGCKFFGEIAIATGKCDGVHPGLQRPDAEVYGCRKGREIVAGRVANPNLENISDTCKGDSGGPAFILSNEDHPEGRTAAFDEAMDTGNYFLAGITSRAIVTQTFSNGTNICGVGTGSGGIYSLAIGPTKQWIIEELKNWKLSLDE